jgi:LPS-assembly lipoprotein
VFRLAGRLIPRHFILTRHFSATVLECAKLGDHTKMVRIGGGYHDRASAHGRMMRVAAALAIAALAGGCFQPLYGEQSPTGGPVLRDQLSAVDVLQIQAPKGTDEARIAVEIRNALLYDFTGGGYAAPPTHRLKIAMSSTRSTIIVDVHTSRPDVENYGINATYSLTEIGTGNVVVTGQTFARVSYDIPGQEQRFARVRGLRDAELRAAKVIADNIRSRLASYFIAGT